MRRTLRTVLVASLLIMGEGLSVRAEAPSPELGGKLSLDEIAQRSAGGADTDVLEFFPPFYKKQKPRVKLLCSRMALDMRSDVFADLVASIAKSDLYCRGCGPLGKMVVSTCKGARSPRSIPPVAQGRMQREPHAAVIGAAGELFMALAADVETREETALFIRRLSERIEGGVGLSPGAKEYLSVVTASADKLFGRFLPAEVTARTEPRGYAAPLNPHEREKVLDDLF